MHHCHWLALRCTVLLPGHWDPHLLHHACPYHAIVVSLQIAIWTRIQPKLRTYQPDVDFLCCLLSLGQGINYPSMFPPTPSPTCPRLTPWALLEPYFTPGPLHLLFSLTVLIFPYSVDLVFLTCEAHPVYSVWNGETHFLLSSRARDLILESSLMALTWYLAFFWFIFV